MTFQELFDKFRKDDLDIRQYFGSYQNWFNVLDRRGMLDQLDPIGDNKSEEWQNDYLLRVFKNDRNRYYTLMSQILGDIIYENGELFWVGEPEDLAYLFCDNRNDLSVDTIKHILIGDDFFEPYWDTTDNVYRDVIEELDKENLNSFKERIVKELQGQQLSPETEEMELIASEQGHNNYWQLSSENVARIIDDEESMNSLLEDKLSDIKSELYSIHTNSYNSAYISEVYEKIWKEIDDYFNVEKREWFTINHPYKKDTKIHKIKMPIYDFEGVVNSYLEENAKWGRDGNLDNHGGFLELLKSEKNCLSVSYPEYPNMSEVDKNINSYFKDYF